MDRDSQERRFGSGTIVLIAGLGVVLAVGLVTGLLATQRSGASQPASLNSTGAPAVPAAPPAPVTHTVTYELSGGTGALNITYVIQGSGIAQVAEARTPWSVTIDDQTTAGGAQYYSLSAQNAGSGMVKCRISVDGQVVSESSAPAPQGVVRCSKSLG